MLFPAETQRRGDQRREDRKQTRNELGSTPEGAIVLALQCVLCAYLRVSASPRGKNISVRLHPYPSGCLMFHSSSCWGAISGPGITYLSVAQLPRSMRRQRSLQNGKSGLSRATAFLQIGQVIIRRLRAKY